VPCSQHGDGDRGQSRLALGSSAVADGDHSRASPRQGLPLRYPTRTPFLTSSSWRTSAAWKHVIEGRCSFVASPTALREIRAAILSSSSRSRSDRPGLEPLRSCFLAWLDRLDVQDGLLGARGFAGTRRRSRAYLQSGVNPAVVIRVVCGGAQAVPRSRPSPGYGHAAMVWTVLRPGPRTAAAAPWAVLLDGLDLSFEAGLDRVERVAESRRGAVGAMRRAATVLRVRW